MNNKPKISVIIPVYNVENYLQECLDSLLKQTLQDFEILCVNDGSTDRSTEILEKYAASEPRIRIIHQKHSNAGTARNNGLMNAKGEYLSFLDADDFFAPTMLEKAYSTAVGHDSDIVVFRVKQYFESDGHIKPIDWSVKESLLPDKKIFRFSDIARDAFCCILGYTWDKLIRTDLVRKNHLYFQSQEVYNDGYFTYSALLMADSIVFLDQYYVFQRKRSSKDSITDRRALYPDCAYRLLAALKDFLVRQNLYDRYEQDFKNYVVHLLYVDIVQSDRSNEKSQRIMHWLDEFEVNGYRGRYYYHLPEYEKLLELGVKSTSSYVKKDQKSHKELVTIPVVYATDSSYLRYTIVSIVSLLQNAGDNTFYDIYLLVPENMKLQTDELENRFRHFDRHRISCLTIGNEFDDAKLCIPHITTPTFYRLALPTLLPQYDKCIYLDGDTIICGDLQEMYDIELKENYLAGVPAFIYFKHEEDNRKRLAFARDEAFVYVNAGSIIMNLSKMREDFLINHFMLLLQKEYEGQDQDILNIACKNNILLLPLRYNMMTKYYHWQLEDLSRWVTPKEIVEGKADPLIIHYADQAKPWNQFDTPCSNAWLSIAMSHYCWDLFCDIQEHLYSCEEALSENQIIRKSVSYRVGRAMTLLPRKIYGGIKCYREHDLRYTFNRVLVHLRIKPETQETESES